MNLKYNEIKKLKNGDSILLNDNRYKLSEDAIESFHTEWETEVVTLRVIWDDDTFERTTEIIVANGFAVCGPIYRA